MITCGHRQRLLAEEGAVVVPFNELFSGNRTLCIKARIAQPRDRTHGFADVHLWPLCAWVGGSSSLLIVSI